MPDGVAPLRGEVAIDALEGLRAPRKTLPPKLFYDDEGSRLFGLITELPEYYLTRTELALLREVGPQVGALALEGVAVVEYGAGSETKAEILLSALRRPAAYVPIDVAETAMLEGAVRLGRRFPDLAISPLTADFLGPLRLPPAVAAMPVLGFFPGSTIGNLEPRMAVRFLGQARLTLGAGSMFLLGADRRKDPSLLLPAYDDASGVTAAFAHQAVWNERESRIEMHLVSRREQTFHLAGQAIPFREGETIHTENSYKHSPERLQALVEEAGWRTLRVWSDPDQLFLMTLLQSGEA